ncbi:putative U box domain, armadillo-like helical, Zinc finger, RING/FYVE/PHD-type [Helianthus annuus]|nr:putative U box domain, armadillo-like helical, Zinc finger, RING/FYVE/PHD-type [Helianthus annuus]
MVGNGKPKRWGFWSNKAAKTNTKSEKSKPKPLDEFICPISGSLMFDPVIVSSGQTFERTSVVVCHHLNFVPLLPDGSKPDFSTVIPNLALKKAITSWCTSNRTDSPSHAPDYNLIEASVRKLMTSDEDDVRIRVSERDLINKMAEKPQVMLTHAATQLNPQFVDNHRRFYSSSSEESVIANVPVPDTPPLPLVTRPSCYSSSVSASTSSEIVVDETLNPNPSSTISDEENLCTKLQSIDVVEQQQSVILLRKLTRTDEKARVSICTLQLLGSLRECVVSRDAVVQTNAVAALVNLSLEKRNKVKIVRSGIVPPLIDVLKSGFDESREHAAGALFSLALEEENKMAIGVLGALQPLLHTLHSDSERTRHDSALALYHLSLVQSNRVKLVKLGAVSTLLTMLETGLAGRVLLVLCNLAASNEGKSVLLDSNAVECLFRKLRTESVDSTESIRENCVACLYSLSIGSMRFKGLAKAAGGAEVLREVAESGSERAQEKAKRMLTALRERDDGEEGRDWRALLEGGASQSRYGGGYSTAF